MTAALEGGEWSAARPVRTSPPGNTRYLFYRRLGWPQRQSRPQRDSIPDRPARSQSLYRMSYLAHQYIYIYIYIYIYGLILPLFSRCFSSPVNRVAGLVPKYRMHVILSACPIYRSFATRASRLKIWHFLVIGIERNNCRCTFNSYSVITQFAKLATGEQLCRGCTHRKLLHFKNV